MMSAVGEQIIWMRVQRYLAKHKPRLIVTVGPGAIMAAEAVRILHEPERKVRVVFPHVDIATGILGLTPQDQATTWKKVLTFSLAREIAIKDPEVIVIALPEPTSNVIRDLKNRISFSQTIETHAHAVRALLPVEHIRPLQPKGYAAEVTFQQRKYEAHWPHLLSTRHVMACVAVLANLSTNEQSLENNLKKLRKVKPVSGDLSLEEGVYTSQLLKYTVHPTKEGIYEALDAFHRLKVRGKKIAIVEEMSFLSGDDYTEVGKQVGELADLPVFVGKAMKQAQRAAEQVTPQLDTHYFETVAEAQRWLSQYIQAEDLVLQVSKS